jgi:hypothetical protein
MAEKRNAHRIWLESQKERGYSLELRAAGTIILEYLKFWIVDWTNLAQEIDQWRELLNTVINFPIP